ncbi:hypothetical protein LTR53_017104 [Teratosphaeriaceae sp. CCFEE 6253]|nr:hypothetical protein LTR53_017104 [Teratosphaeriaceae sp. CCFEE 6253]
MDNKVIVIAAFGFRLGMIVIIGLRLASFDEAGFAADPTLFQAQFIAWTSTELNYSLVSATIPIIRPFVNNLSTNYGGGKGSGSNGSGYGGGRSARNYIRTGETPKGNEEFEMGSTQQSRRRHDSDLQGLEGHNYGVQVHAGGREPGSVEGGTALKRVNGDATSVESNDSQELIIRKDVTWRVEQDGSRL